jgi:hypothetical protein
VTAGYDVIVYQQGAQLEEIAIGDLGSPDSSLVTTICNASLTKLPH